MANFRSVLSGEHSAALVVPEHTLAAYAQILERAQCCGVEFKLEDGKISIFGEDDVDFINDIEEAFSQATDLVPIVVAQKVSDALQSGEFSVSPDEWFRELVNQHFQQAESLLSVFMFLVSAGISEPLRLEQVGHMKYLYVTYRDEKLFPIAEEYEHLVAL